jgi:hypothetical protein
MPRAVSVRARARCLCAALALALSPGAGADQREADFPALPFPPEIDGLIGLPQTYGKGRSAYLPLLTREAKMTGLPPDLADAVARVESAFNPNAVGKVGEVGLMQVRPETADMLGYRGPLAGLFVPETNIRYGVAYLSRAWQLAQGDVCRALMKYRAGWGEEQMSSLSAEYCRRARGHLAAIGSPLAQGAEPPATEQSATVAVKPHMRLASIQANAATASRPGVRTISLRPPISRSALPQVMTVASGQLRADTLERALARQPGCQVRVRSPGLVRCYRFAAR